MQLLAAVCPGLLLVDEVDAERAERAERAELEPNSNRTRTEPNNSFFTWVLEQERGRGKPRKKKMLPAVEPPNWRQQGVT